MKVTSQLGVSTKKRRGAQGKIARRRQKDNHFADSLKARTLRTIAESSSDPKSSPLVKSLKDTSKKLCQPNIKIEDIKNDLTTNCVPVTRDAFPKHFPKKDKRKLRCETFLRKLKVGNDFKVRGIEKRKQSEKIADVTVVENTSDLTFIESKSSEGKPRKKNRNQKKKQSILKKKERIDLEFQDMQLFKNILKNSVYKANPGAAITNYVREQISKSLSES